MSRIITQRIRVVASNNAMSFSSLSDEKGSKHTNNVLASPSVDDGLVTVKTKIGVLGKSHSVIMIMMRRQRRFRWVSVELKVTDLPLATFIAILCALKNAFRKSESPSRY